MFSIYYADYPTESFYTLGEYDTAYNYYNDDITWMNADEQMFWMLPLTGFAVGEK